MLSVLLTILSLREKNREIELVPSFSFFSRARRTRISISAKLGSADKFQPPLLMLLEQRAAVVRARFLFNASG